MGERRRQAGHLAKMVPELVATGPSQVFTRSHPHPQVSTDIPYSEAQSTTTTYMSDHPERFGSLAHARDWINDPTT
ncbi:hypothetical protein ACH4TX_44050 [Streptomyces sp. NPDC021098]|uniref:hypothetical protein n=1 Tax=unclassified Streptomyces TaxID=2593676 RepID=UPI00379FFA8E